MQKTFRSYLGRARSLREGRKGTVYTIALDESGLRLSWQNIYGTPGDEFLAWRKVEAARASRKQSAGTLRLCIAFDLAGNLALEINENMGGWDSLIDALPNYLSGCLSAGEWKQTVAAFKSPSDEVIIFQRAQSAHP